MREITWAALSPEERRAILARPQHEGGSDRLRAQVQAIIYDVRTRGDEALADYTERFDGFRPENFAVSSEECADAVQEITADMKAAIRAAYENISRFHEKQGLAVYEVETMPGVSCRRVVRGIEKVGLYIPGGTAPLFSTVLMLGIPAQIAGCREKILCTPCDREGRVNPSILYAAGLCGITRIYRAGGAQAIAAMAYGTRSIAKTDKIFGPGNRYVTMAKTLVSQDPAGAALDMPAGPSEVLVIADETANPAFAAADLLSQAEHDTFSQVVLITLSPEKRQAVLKAVEEQLVSLPRRDIARAALENSLAIVAGSMEEALAISNAYAPEHLILCFDGAEKWLDRVTQAGSVFCGPWTPEAAGDYASGTNHVLPTYGYARAWSGLGVEAFQKSISVQAISRKGLATLGDTVEIMARGEGLEAHARAVELRRKDQEDNG